MLKTRYPLAASVLSLLVSFLGLSCAPQNGESSQAGQVLDVTNGSSLRDGSLISKSLVIVRARMSSGDNSCTGSVLSPTMILTAAHCVTELTRKGERVLVSERKVTVGRSSVAKVVIHPKYYAATDYDKYVVGTDIALVQLGQSLSSQYSPVIVEKDENQVYHQDLQFAGAGAWTLATNEPDSNEDENLASGQIKLKDSVKLANGNSELEFKSGRSGAAICHGDSGGPVYYEKDGRIHQVGVIVGFEYANESDTKKYRCAIQTSTEVVSSVFGSNSEFINNTFRELTGVSLTN